MSGIINSRIVNITLKSMLIFFLYEIKAHGPRPKPSLPLHIASANGDLKKVKSLLGIINSGKNINPIDLKDAQEYTSLHYAVIYNQYHVVCALLDLQATVDCRNIKRQTPLHYAAKYGYEKIVQKLLEKSASRTVQDFYESTALHYAALYDHDEIVKKLLDYPPEGEANKSLQTKNKEGQTSFFVAVEQGNLKAIRALLQYAKVFEINEPENSGFTPLHFAIKNSNNISQKNTSKEIVNLLLKKGALTEKADKNGQTPLHLAVITLNLPFVEALLNSNANINVQDNDGLTPLHHASINNALEITAELLKRGANITIQDSDGNTPLHYAIRQAHTDIVTRLMSNSSKNKSINIPNKKGKTPLHIAIEKGNEDLCANLLAHGAAYEARDIEGYAPLHYASFYGHLGIVDQLTTYRASAKDYNPALLHTPLHSAAMQGHDTIVKSLCNAGADVNAKDSLGNTPLHTALTHKHNLVSKILLESDAEPNIANNEGKTPLHIAVIQSLGDSVTLLIDVANPNLQDNDGNTPLHYVSENGTEEIAQKLIKNVADQRIINKIGQTVLHKLAKDGKTEIVRYLLTMGASTINVQDMYKLTALHYAVLGNHKEVVTILLTFHAQLKISDLKGKTALHYAASLGNLEFVRKLIDKDSSLMDMVDSLGNSPLHYAIINGHSQVVELLIEKGSDPSLTNKNGYSALYLAVVGDSIEILEKILASKKALEESNLLGETPLHKAVMDGKVSSVRKLLEAGSNSNAQDDFGNSPLHLVNGPNSLEIVKLLIEYAASPFLTNTDGYTAAHVAAQRSNSEVLRELLNFRDLFDKVDKKGRTPLLVALESTCSEDCFEILINVGSSLTVFDHNKRGALHYAASNNVPVILKKILRRITDSNNSNSCNVYLNAQDIEGKTPLHNAVITNCLEKVQDLITSSASLSLLDTSGLTPLAYAVRSASLPLCKLLFQEPSNFLEKITHDGNTLLHLVALNKSPGVAYYLVAQYLEKKLNLSPKNFKGITPLHAAVLEGNNELYEALTKNGVGEFSTLEGEVTCLMTAVKGQAPQAFLSTLLLKFNTPEMINAKDCHKQTALHYASSSGKEDYVRLLLEQPHCDINARDCFNWSALDHAVDNGNENCVTLLLEKNSQIIHRNSKGQTALHRAVLMGNYEICRKLLEHISDDTERLDYVNLGDNFGKPAFFMVASMEKRKENTTEHKKKILDLMAEHGANFDQRDNLGKNLLYYLLEQENRQLASVLVQEKSIGIKSRIKDGNSELTLLHLAARGTLSKDSTSDIEFLSDKEKDFREEDQTLYDNKLCNPLYYAIISGRLDISYIFLRKKMFAVAKDLEKQEKVNFCISPFVLAVKMGNMLLVELFIIFIAIEISKNNRATLNATDYKTMCLQKIKEYCERYNQWILRNQRSHKLIDISTLEKKFGKYCIENIERVVPTLDLMAYDFVKNSQ